MNELIRSLSNNKLEKRFLNVFESNFRFYPYRNMFDKFEKKKFLEKVRKNFLNLKEWLPKENIVFIDASADKETVLLAIKQEVDQLLKM